MEAGSNVGRRTVVNTTIVANCLHIGYIECMQQGSWDALNFGAICYLSCVLQFKAKIDGADDHATELKSMCFSSVTEL